MARNTPIIPACASNINAKKLLDFLYTFQVARITKGISNCIQQTKQLAHPIQLDRKTAAQCLHPFCMKVQVLQHLFKRVKPSIETANVTNEEIRPMTEQSFSFFKKKVASPVSNGINISKTGIICPYPLKGNFNFLNYNFLSYSFIIIFEEKIELQKSIPYSTTISNT